MTGLACVHRPVTHVRTWLSSSFACSPFTHSLKLGNNNDGREAGESRAVEEEGDGDE